jgi:hypothetical protein
VEETSAEPRVEPTHRKRRPRTHTQKKKAKNPRTRERDIGSVCLPMHRREVHRESGRVVLLKEAESLFTCKGKRSQTKRVSFLSVLQGRKTFVPLWRSGLVKKSRVASFFRFLIKA